MHKKAVSCFFDLAIAVTVAFAAMWIRKKRVHS
jgi:hypothetical protein